MLVIKPLGGGKGQGDAHSDPGGHQRALVLEALITADVHAAAGVGAAVHLQTLGNGEQRWPAGKGRDAAAASDLLAGQEIAGVNARAIAGDRAEREQGAGEGLGRAQGMIERHDLYGRQSGGGTAGGQQFAVMGNAHQIILK